MKEYHKIQSVYKRDNNTHKFILGEYSKVEFKYLANNIWEFTEKIDGTNIRINWNGVIKRIGGRTDNAQIPTFLYDKLTTMFPDGILSEVLGDREQDVTLYGEGYGAKIQKGGGNYIPDGVSFILFDVKIGDWWLMRKDVEEIASRLSIDVVPIIGEGTLAKAEGIVANGYKSHVGTQQAEGFVLRPRVELKGRNGQRIITKMKTKDF